MRGVPCGRDARRRLRRRPAAFSVPRAATPPVTPSTPPPRVLPVLTVIDQRVAL